MQTTVGTRDSKTWLVTEVLCSTNCPSDSLEQFWKPPLILGANLEDIRTLTCLAIIRIAQNYPCNEDLCCNFKLTPK